LISEEGVVHSADPSRCIGCPNCVYACPFGVPKFDVQARLMKKCNLCYDRTVRNLLPWCAQACPTQAIWYGDFEEFAARRRGHPIRDFGFGEQNVQTRVFFVMPEEIDRLDVAGMLRGIEAELGEGAARTEEAWIV
jgi:Fe-S-cluster-containing dehydrogenase component